MRKVWMVIPLIALTACQSNLSRQASEGSVSALELARSAFESEYVSWGSHYEIRSVKRSSVGEDCFFFIGTGDFARPGYHARICVSKTDRSIRIVPGE